jgi:excisionase family DNA binding protein
MELFYRVNNVASDAEDDMDKKETSEPRKKRQFMRVSEVSEVLDLSRAKVYNLVADKVIPSVKVDGAVRVPIEAFNAWLKKFLKDGSVASPPPR